MAHKGSREFPNEDAALLLVDERRALLAVADGHHGWETSHYLLEALEGGIPLSLGQLSLALADVTWPEPLPMGGSTLAVACLDRAKSEVFGLSFGDSSVIKLNTQRSQLMNLPNEDYLRPPFPVATELATAFRFLLNEGEGLIVATDGILECCYRDPSRSVQLHHVSQLWQESARESFVPDLVGLALKGVDGHPGGQDNIAVVAYLP